ncbi:MAG: toll/interleukin-1 receptor domain-containing protein [Planctomycetes bacterium]|nr:toll/interleukin-1 receptor domain-containing protein [Planctomycetota bacterium]
MSEPVVTPKVFISYSWTNEEHVDWVEGIANRLEADSIPVVFDQWDLTHGQDKFAYMERMVGDPTITKVLMICDRKYVEKADARDGGVGVETVIITPEVYNKTAQTKFIPILRERDEDGEAFLPIYLKSRIYIDFCDDDNFAESYDKLLRDITNKPTRKRPPRGEKLPAHLLEEDAPFVATGPKLEKLKHCQQRSDNGPKTRVGPGHRASGGPRDSAHLVK